MRSYVKVYSQVVQGRYPDTVYYGHIGEVPGQDPTAVYAIGRLKKKDLVIQLNHLTYTYVSEWNGPDAVPPGFTAVRAIDFVGQLLHVIPYSLHPKN